MKKNLTPNQFDYSGIYVEGQRGTFNFKKPVAATFMSGMLVPLGDPIPIFPGVKPDLTIDCDIRSNTMVCPPLDPMYVDFFAVWIPHRIVWNHMPQFTGENDTTAWTQSSTYVYPSDKLGSINNNLVDILFDPGVASGSTSATNIFLAPHYGLFYGSKLTGKPANNLNINVLAFRGYYAAWNHLFRDENYQRPVLFSKGDTGSSGEFGYFLRDYKLNSSLDIFTQFNTAFGLIISYGDPLPIGAASLMPVNKFHDAFTSVLPEPQYGDAVTLPLGETAPIIGASSLHSVTTNGILFGNNASTPVALSASQALGTGIGGSLYAENGSSFTAATKVGSTNLVADLRNATAASINTFRTSVMYQRYCEALARGGRRTPEYYHSIYGIKNTKAAADYPELLTRSRYLIGINQVVATADSSGSGWTSHLGDTGAYSYTKLRNIPVCEKDFTEFGYLHIFYCVRAANRYSQMIQPHFLRHELLDEYNPYFDHIGDVGIPNTTVNVLATLAVNFGYQEAWWDERTQLSMAVGAVNKLYGDLKYWTISEIFDASLVTCTNSFLTFDPAVLDDIFVSAYYTYPQFIIDACIKGKIAKRMSPHSIPGIAGRI